jgi:hypothetical protein
LPLIKPMSSPKFVPPSAKSRPGDEPGAPLEPPVATGLIPPPPVDSRIHSISIGRNTGGFNSDDAPGDDGVIVVVSARNDRGEPVIPAGETTIVLLDPAVPGEGARYARWDSSSDGAAGLYRRAEGTAPDGAYFELPWPDAPPAHDRLHLFVRLTTEAGTKLEADREIVINQTGGDTDRRRAGGFAATSGIVPAAAQGASSNRLSWGRPPAAKAIDVPGALPARLDAEAAPIPTDLPLEAEGPLLFPASELAR